MMVLMAVLCLLGCCALDKGTTAVKCLTITSLICFAGILVTMFVGFIVAVDHSGKVCRGAYISYY